MTTFWQKARAAALYVGIGAALAVVVGHAVGFHREEAKAAAPVQAPETEASQGMAAEVVPCRDGPLVVKQPTPKEADDLAARYGIQVPPAGPPMPPEKIAAQAPPGAQDEPVPASPDSGFRILGEFVIQPLEWGGTALSWTDEAGRPQLTVKPKPLPFFQLPNVWEFYAAPGWGTDGMSLEVGALYDSLRLGRLHLKPEAYLLAREDGSVDAGARLRVSLVPK